MPSPRFTVAYALTAKKTKSFMQPKLESHARFFTFPPSSDENYGSVFIACSSDQTSFIESHGHTADLNLL